MTSEKSSSHMGNGESSNKRAVALFANAQRLLRHAALGDFALPALHAHLTAVLVEDGPHDAAIHFTRPSW